MNIMLWAVITISVSGWEDGARLILITLLELESPTINFSGLHKIKKMYRFWIAEIVKHLVRLGKGFALMGAPDLYIDVPCFNKCKTYK